MLRDTEQLDPLTLSQVHTVFVSSCCCQTRIQLISTCTPGTHHFFWVVLKANYFRLGERSPNDYLRL